MSRILLIFSVLLHSIFLIGARSIPTITYITADLAKNVGDSLQLICAVENLTQDRPVLWKKVNIHSNDEVLLSSNSSLIIADNRFNISYNANVSAYILQIKNIQAADDGIYECQVFISSYTCLHATTALHVRRAPMISNNSSRTVISREGDSAQLKCYASGYPTPMISWHREDNTTLPTGNLIYRGNVLTILPVHIKDGGVYYCKAENVIKPDAEHKVTLQVETVV